MQLDVPAPLLDVPLPLRDALPHHPKPRGQAPRSGGVLCTWDFERGCWLDQHSQPFAVRSDAERQNPVFFNTTPHRATWEVGKLIQQTPT